ncbi:MULTISPECIES: carbon-nitrogen hydrolase family protein [unclassified Roseitalea]|uniref:carbon-nitrogen hydrolase family protein n=1 Tax=unclassified Roseitalea TaxID=2639107 RepID=UPI00273E53AF|nr:MULTISPECIES: carbon-nitrogen hydrolase family protein [unclassified Roseitalea]
MRVAAIQMRSGTDVARNVADFTELVAEAAAGGADYVQTPEMTGLVQKDRAALMAAIADQAGDPLFARASQLAADHRLWLHVGSTPVARDGGRVANRAALFAPDGGLAATYDKIHMFDVDLDHGESWRESAIYAPGDRMVICGIDGTTVGLAICYDLRFAHLFRDLAMAGATVLTAPAAFTRQTGQAHWHVLLRARAIENGAFMIAAAQGGDHEDGRQTYGHSMIVDPWGRIVAEKADDEPGVIAATIDLSEVGAARARIPSLRNARGYGGQPEQEDGTNR